jgi:hypothetical protein
MVRAAEDRAARGDACELIGVDARLDAGRAEDAGHQVEVCALRGPPCRDLLGHAVDLVPYVNGKLRWEWEPIYVIAAAVNQAARELNVSLRWGGVWDVSFNTLQPTPEAMGTAVEEAVARVRSGHDDRR